VFSSLLQLFEPLAQPRLLVLAALFEHALGRCAGALARCLSGGLLDRAPLDGCERSVVDAGVGDSLLDRRFGAGLEVGGRDAAPV
jgi:hypothetical protein